MTIKLKNLNKTIIKCKKCPRLTKFISKISTEKRKQNINETYWGKPVPGFGDPNAKLLILGLAPAAHGGTRTGRAFTGDKSGEFLFKCLYKAKIANQPLSENSKDDLKLHSAYITNILKCVPPADKPSKNELNNCKSWIIFSDSQNLKIKFEKRGFKVLKNKFLNETNHQNYYFKDTKIGINFYKQNLFEIYLMSNASFLIADYSGFAESAIMISKKTEYINLNNFMGIFKLIDKTYIFFIRILKIIKLV